MRILLLLCAAVAAALGAGLFLFTGREAPSMPTQPPVAQVAPVPATVDVYTADMRLPAGTFLVNVGLGRTAMERGSVTDDMVVADQSGREFLKRGVVSQTIAKGAPIPRSSVIHPGDRGFLAAVLPAGKRAISIEITEVAGVSGLALPGDHVDLILTYEITAEQGDFERDIHASETVVRDIRVLALDQRLQAADQSLDKNGQPVPPPVASTATLEVTPHQAEMISLAAQLGTLSLALNSAQDGAQRGGVAPPMDLMSGGEGGLDTLMGPILRSQPEREAVRDAGISVAQRPLTMDTDVTSLLARLMEDAKDHKLDAIPRLNKVEFVQVVRGARGGAVRIGKTDLEKVGGEEDSAEETTPVQKD
ncbi:MAG: Flp pilus assembly protein CpaB [Rhodobacteraceae bacterium]|nr:Flp pilus assembly protein CpaB [Paracoccaceae bacterium]